MRELFYELIIKDDKKVKSSIFSIIELMEQTLHLNQSPNINQTINKTDRIRDSIKLSQIRMESTQKLTKKQKQTIIRYITNDYAYNLSKYIEKRAIKLQTQLGHQGGNWNLLHFAVKCNSLECIEFIIRQFYALSPDDFDKFINSKTVEGYTPVMVAIINESNDALSTLLKYGAIDIGAVDCKRMTAYELAINYKNQQAIRVLMNYENQSRKQKQANKPLLQQPMIFIKRQQGCCYRSFMYLFQCLSFGLYSNLNHDQVKTSNSSPRKTSLLNIDFMTDRVKISRDPQQQAQYDIEWKQVSDMITNLKYPLFQNYNPFDIGQKNIPLKHNLILLQCLSQHPWVIRKILQIDRTKPKHYNINLFMNFQQKKFNINNEVPFLKDRQQPMFIENHNQMWPMLLQKGLAKAHGSYFDIQNVQIKQLIQELTGCPTFQIDLSSMENLQIFALLREIHAKGYMHLLQGTQGSHLSNQGKKDCFSVLQFFDKNDKKLILVNCPFVDQAWKEKEKYEMHSLKLIKSHFNNHDQMCVWIEVQRLQEYFSKILVSLTLPNYERVALRAKVKNELFFTFKVNKERQEKIIFQLINLETKKTVKFREISAYMNEGSKRVQFMNGICGEEFAEGVVSAETLIGDYMCCISIDKPAENEFDEDNIAQSLIHSKIDKKMQKFMLLMWSADGVAPKYLDENLGPIEFLQCIQLNTMKSWTQSQIYRIEIVSDYAMIMIKDKDESSKMYMSLQVQQSDLIQGKQVSESTVELIRNEDEDPYFSNFFFCIIRNASRYGLSKKSSYIKDPNNMGPAGESSVGKKLTFFSE